MTNPDPEVAMADKLRLSPLRYCKSCKRWLLLKSDHSGYCRYYEEVVQ